MAKVLKEVQAFDPASIREIIGAIQAQLNNDRIDLGVKHILECWVKALRAAEEERKQEEKLSATQREMADDITSPEEQRREKMALSAWELKRRKELLTEMLSDKLAWFKTQGSDHARSRD
jgi:phosphoenolpyruvate synthase/pyruvate phosphate dikinase